MKIGFPNHPRKNIFEEIKWIGENGFEFVDLFFEPETTSIEKIEPEPIKQALKEFNLEATGHLAWYLPIGSAMVQLRRSAIEIATEYFDVLGKIGVRGVTIHSNWPSMSLFSGEEGVEFQIDSLKKLVDKGSEKGLTIFYEPIGSKQDSEENLEKILDAVPEVGCHLDLGHCNLHGKNPAGMIRQFKDRLCHLHLHDNYGDADMHLPPGTGNIDWNEVFVALRDIGYNGTVTLEVFSNDRDYALLARKKIEALRTRFFA